MSDQAGIRLLVVDDQELMSDGLVALLSRQAGIAVVGTAADGAEALQQVEEVQLNVMLMDVRMPVLDGVQATMESRRRWPIGQVLMLIAFDDDAYIVEALRAGAAGYIFKNILAHDLAAAIRLAHRGVVQLDPAVAAKVAGALASSTTRMGTSGAAGVTRWRKR